MWGISIIYQVIDSQIDRLRMAELQQVSRKLQIGLTIFTLRIYYTLQMGHFPFIFLSELDKSTFFSNSSKCQKIIPFFFFGIFFFLTNYHLQHVFQWQPHFLVFVETINKTTTKKKQIKKLFRTQQATGSHQPIQNHCPHCYHPPMPYKQPKAKTKQNKKNQPCLPYWHFWQAAKLMWNCFLMQGISLGNRCKWLGGLASRVYGGNPPPKTTLLLISTTISQWHHHQVSFLASTLPPIPCKTWDHQGLGLVGHSVLIFQGCHWAWSVHHLGSHQHLLWTRDFCFTKAPPWSMLTPPPFRFWLLPLAIHLLWHTHLWKYKKYLFCYFKVSVTISTTLVNNSFVELKPTPSS